MVYRNYPIPPGDEKARCSVAGCVNAATALLVIKMPHRSLFERAVWGKPGETQNVAPATATISLCDRCAAKAAGFEPSDAKPSADPSSSPSAPKGADTLYFRDPNQDRAARLRKERGKS